MRRSISRLLSALVYASFLGIFAAPAGAQSANGVAPVNWTAASQSGVFEITVGPAVPSVPIGQFHDWTMRISDNAGQPIEQARIAIGGGMPGHGHGMPSKPQVTRYIGKGVYLIEGMKFNMAGDWVLMFAIETSTQRDRVKFDVVIDY